MLIELAIIALALYVAYWVFTPILASFYNQKPTNYQWQYIDPNTIDSQTGKHKRTPFPSLFDRSSKLISLIVPSYNEELRLPKMLQETVDYLTECNAKDSSFTWEIIIVDDGSKDRTSDVALKWSKEYSVDLIRLLRLSQNQGKGGAVQQGMLHARGQYLLMVDADGATQITDLEKLVVQIRRIETKGMAIAIGSRAHLEEAAVARRKWYRNILMYGFHFLKTVLTGIREIRDTQCGFKLFSRQAAQWLFYNQHLRRWCFDAELLFIAKKLRIPMIEVAVNWAEIPGSKLQLLEASFDMARDLLVIRLAYLFSIWSIVTPFNSTNRHLQDK